MSYKDKEKEKAKRKEYDKEYNQRPERKAKRRERAKTPEIKAYMKDYLYEYDRKPERKAKRRQDTKDLKLEVYSVYSKRQSNSEIPCCRCCGENTDIRFLAVDHIDGRANLPKKEQKLYAEKITSWLKRNHYPEGFQILCHNCNSAKGNSVDNKCPHERERN